MTIKSRHSASDCDRLEIASDWLLRIQAGALESEELAQWLQWYDAESANRAAFEKVQATFESIHALPRSERSAWASRLDELQQSERKHFGERVRHRFHEEIRSIWRQLVPLPWFSRRVWAAGFTLSLVF